jgi:hypothetical protein
MDPKRDMDAPAFSFGGRPGERRGDYQHPESLPVLSDWIHFLLFTGISLASILQLPEPLHTVA